jgi:8-oxo-dGTP pyrophosphatase MutT (NUDIX family)
MQLRDNFPHIAHPVCWGLFGGYLQPGETPETPLVRDVIEEINYEVPSFSKFRMYADKKIIPHVFQGPLLVGLDQLDLNKGWDMGLLRPEDILQSSYYSVIAKEVRPLGITHQQIMLDFLQELSK